MTIQVLHERGLSKRTIGRHLHVDERTVRYQLRREAKGRPDGRRDKPFRAEALAGVIEQWMAEAEQGRGGVNLQVLYERLVRDCRNYRPSWTHSMNIGVQNLEVGHEQCAAGRSP